MRKFYFLKSRQFIGMIFVATFSVIAFLVIQDYRKLPEGGVRQFNRQIEPLKLGPLKIGGDIPLKPKLERAETPKDVFITSKFYVNIAEPNPVCFGKYCNIHAAAINTMGGWLEARETGVTIDELFGLDLEENRNVQSIVIIGDHNGKIIGIYPNKGLKDVLSILQFYPELANSDLLKGVDEFSSLKVGELAPLHPGDSIKYLSERLEKFSIDRIPAGKKFYLYSLQKNDSGGDSYFCDIAGCKYLGFADASFDLVEDLQGWFLASDNDNKKMIGLFGLDLQKIISGESSLVVLTDAKGVIIALYPQKTISDALTILSQHLDLADISRVVSNSD